MYKPGCIVVSGYTDDSPEFSEIIEVILDEDGVLYFVLQKLLPPEYFSHYHAYTVDRGTLSITFVCKQEELLDHHPYNFHQSFNVALRNVYFIVLKYHLFVDK